MQHHANNNKYIKPTLYTIAAILLALSISCYLSAQPADAAICALPAYVIILAAFNM